LLDWEMKGTVS